MFNKKGISPVVATALLLVVAVVSVVGFSSWVTSFSSKVFVDVESDSSRKNSIFVESLVGDKLYLKTSDNLTINSIFVSGVECDFTGNVSNLVPIDLSDCLENVSGEAEILINSNVGLEESFVYVDSDIISVSESLNLNLGPTDPNCYNSNNVGTVGTWNGCNGMLIVNRSMLDLAIESGNDFRINFGGNDYTFGDSSLNIFTGQVTNFSELFLHDANFNVDIGYWDTSSATNFKAFFFNASSFNQDISNWNTSNVLDMMLTFYRATSFDQALNWDTSSVTTMNGMFGNTIFNRSLTFNTSSVVNMEFMFYDAIAYNQDLSLWDVDQVLFCSNFERNLGEWNLPKPNFTNCNPAGFLPE